MVIIVADAALQQNTKSFDCGGCEILPQPAGQNIVSQIDSGEFSKSSVWQLKSTHKLSDRLSKIHR